MNSQRITGTVLLVVGVILLTLGMNASHSAADRWSNFFTGHFTDATMWFALSEKACVS
jgi:succinate dehydrogenase hydrophobic anchor subunit